MNNKKRLTLGDFETLMKMFERIIQNCDRATAKKILDILRDVEHTIFDFNEEHGINQCDCSECESDREKDAILTEEGRVIRSDLTPEEIEKVQMRSGGRHKKIHDPGDVECYCPECESDRKEDTILTDKGRVKKSDLTPDELDDLYMEVWKGTKAIRDLLTEEKQSSKDKAYIKWKKDFLKKKQKEGSEEEK